LAYGPNDGVKHYRNSNWNTQPLINQDIVQLGQFFFVTLNTKKLRMGLSKAKEDEEQLLLGTHQ
jgi:hypothetical protein